MRCQRLQHLYDEYTRGLLPTATMTRIEEHLAGCNECRDYYELNDRIAAGVRGGGEVAHPGPDYFDALAGQVLDRLDHQRESVAAPDPLAALDKPAWRRPMWWSWGMAAAALLALGIAPLWQTGSSPAPRMTAQLTPVQTREAEPAQSASETVVVENPESARRELVLAAAPTRDSAAAAGTENSTAPPAETTESNLKALDKSVSGSQSNNQAVENIIRTPREPLLASRSESEKPLSEAEREAARETEMKVVSIRQQAEQADRLTREIFDQYQLIKTQLIAGSDQTLYEKMAELEETINRRISDRSDLEALPSVRQVKLFVQAQEALDAGRPLEASTLYQRILLVDEQTPLAARACLQLADLFYSEWADFREAERYYGRCEGTSAQEALTTPEREHVRLQLERLKRYSDNAWQTLTHLHMVHRAPWNEALTALRELVENPDAAALMPEAGRTIVERLQHEESEPGESALEVYQLLSQRSRSESNAEIRAWLELALGDLQATQFQQFQPAIDHYSAAVEAVDSTSAVAQAATTKREQLIDRQLLDLAR